MAIMIIKIDLINIDLVNAITMTIITVPIPETHASFARNHTVDPGSIY
jgi:hypothetical protein